jgi:hypothetical protein
MEKKIILSESARTLKELTEVEPEAEPYIVPKAPEKTEQDAEE